jgi:hypothetical protein
MNIKKQTKMNTTPIKPDYESLIEEKRKEFFESDRFKAVREILAWIPPDSEGQEDSLETLLNHANLHGV